MHLLHDGTTRHDEMTLLNINPAGADAKRFLCGKAHGLGHMDIASESAALVHKKPMRSAHDEVGDLVCVEDGDGLVGNRGLGGCHFGDIRLAVVFERIRDFRYRRSDDRADGGER